MESKKKLVVAVSGGFDPLHIGHIRHFEGAKKVGDILIVFLQGDDWLIKKKGYAFMPYEERKEILESIKWVDRVVRVIDTDMTVAKTLTKYKPDIFVKGGDRTPDNIPQEEQEACEKNGIQIMYDNMGGKVQSSSWLVDKVRKDEKKDCS